MITAHIKAPSGNRTEEWEDYQVKPSVAMFVEGTDAYVLGWIDDAGEELLDVAPKQLWDMIEEVMAFANNEPDEQPAVTAFARDTLQKLATTFKQYLDIEKVVLQQNAFSSDECESMIGNMQGLKVVNDDIYVGLAPVRSLIADKEQTGDLKLAIRGLIQAMYDFSNELARNIFALEVVLKGLKVRSDGGEYSPLDYVRDVNLVKKQVESRQAIEKGLMSYRSAFKKATSVNDRG